MSIEEIEAKLETLQRQIDLLARAVSQHQTVLEAQHALAAGSPPLDLATIERFVQAPFDAAIEDDARMVRP